MADDLRGHKIWAAPEWRQQAWSGRRLKWACALLSGRATILRGKCGGNSYRYFASRFTACSRLPPSFRQRDLTSRNRTNTRQPICARTRLSCQSSFLSFGSRSGLLCCETAGTALFDKTGRCTMNSATGWKGCWVLCAHRAQNIP